MAPSYHPSERSQNMTQSDRRSDHRELDLRQFDLRGSYGRGGGGGYSRGGYGRGDGRGGGAPRHSGDLRETVERRRAAAGDTAEPEAQLNPKKKIWEKVQPLLCVSSSKVACFEAVPFMTSKGPCVVDTLTSGAIG